MRLQTYCVHDGDEDYAWRWLAWASDTESAKEVCLGWADCGAEDLTAWPWERLQNEFREGERAYIEGDNELLRHLGFRCESDRTCDTCGLAEMDGEYPVCQDCGQCEECVCNCDEFDGTPNYGEFDSLPQTCQQV